MMAATLAVLAVLLLALLIMLALLGASALQRRRTSAVGVDPPRPSLGSPAQVLLERGERAGRRLEQLAERQPILAGACDDAAAVVAELRTAAAQVAAVDRARASLSVPALREQQQRLDAAIASAAGTEGEADLRAAGDSIAGQLATAARHRAAREALLARMRAAVTGLEQTETELAGLLAELQAGLQTDLDTGTLGAAGGRAPGDAMIALEDRLAGLRAGLVEVRGLGTLDVDPGQVTDQGLPGDLPGPVEPPPRT